MIKSIVLTIKEYIQKTSAIVEFDIRKLRHDPTELFLRSIQPALWLLLFGQVLAYSKIFSTDKINYLDFLTPGVLAQSVLFVAIFNGISIIWERDFGITHKLVVAPIARSSIVIGKGLGSAVRALLQMVIIYILAVLLGVKLNWSLIPLLSVILFVILGAMLFSTFSLVIACIVKTRERFMGIGQVLTMPLFFASNAIYPIHAMPTWLQTIAHANPLTYEIDALRTVMLPNFESAYGLGTDLLVMTAFTAVFTVIGTFLYPRLAR